MSEAIVTPSATVLKWCREFEVDVHAGRVSLVELVEVALSDLENGWELCPMCAERVVRDTPGETSRGVCRVCLLKRMNQTYREVLAELAVARENARLRKEAQRMRDEMDPDRPRRPGPGSREYNRWVYESDAPIMQACTSCGRPFPPHSEALECAECLERRERRASGRQRREREGSRDSADIIEDATSGKRGQEPAAEAGGQELTADTRVVFATTPPTS